MRLMITKLVGVVLMLSATMSPAGAGSEAAKATESDDGWPQTRAGELGRGWVEAFSTGEGAMREFLAREMAPKSLAGKSVRQRIERYKDLRERYGKLVLASVVKSTPAELTVKLLDADLESHEFIFAIQTGSPYKLVSVSIREPGHGFGGFHH